MAEVETVQNGVHQKATYQLGAVIPFFAIHLACVGVFFVPFHWRYVGLALALYLVRMFGVTAGYHRYFSHRSFRLSRPMQFALAFLAETFRRRECCGGQPTIGSTMRSRIRRRIFIPRGRTASGGRTSGG